MYKKRMNKKNWESAEQVFAALNDSFPYLVIRNYEDFYNSLLMDNHSDIDLLCHKKDRKKIIQLLEAEPRLARDDGIHYKFQVASQQVPLDIRYDGDGYYDKNWEREMLRSRVLEPRGFYCMNTNEYFWSLLYHALYHKGPISEEYLSRLEGLKPELFPADQSDLERHLSCFMQQHRYYYTIAKDPYLWYHFTDFCERRIRTYPLYPVYHFAQQCREFIAQKTVKRKE